MSNEIKSHLQNLSDEMRSAESELNYLASKIKPGTGNATTHDVLIMAIDRVSRTRDKMKAEEDYLKRKLVEQ